MAAINPLARELVLKIVFYGPGLGGKTTTLQHIHEAARPEHRGKMVSLATAVDRTLYFDFLPLRVPKTRGMSVRLQLFTVPGQVYYNATRKLVLTGTDGLVFVADSQAARQDANLESLENLLENLRDQRRELGAVPHIFLYNKRDLDDVLPVADLERELNVYRAPSFATVATRGTGVFEGLSSILRLTIDAVNRSAPATEGVGEIPLAVAEEGLSQALLSETGSTPVGRDVAIVSQNVLEPPEPRWSDMPPAAVGSAPVTILGGQVAAAASAAVAAVAASTTSDKRTTPPPQSFLSMASLWEDEQRGVVHDVERDLCARNYLRALEGLDGLATQTLRAAGAMLGADGGAPPGLFATLLGVSGERILAFRALLQEARAGAVVEERAALAAFVLVLELQAALGRARRVV